MKIEILRKVLQLDSLVSVLDWRERVIVHFLMRDQIDFTTSKITSLYDWILKEKWECPERNYGQDRILYFFDVKSEKWMSTDHYLKLFKEYEPWMKQLRNN